VLVDTNVEAAVLMDEEVRLGDEVIICEVVLVKLDVVVVEDFAVDSEFDMARITCPLNS
jgi:hypothetical protein